MRNLLSLIIGGVSLLLVVIAFFPLLGWANWFIIPLPVIGLAIGVTAPQTSGRDLNIVVIVVGVMRLLLGGGIF